MVCILLVVKKFEVLCKSKIRVIRAIRVLFVKTVSV